MEVEELKELLRIEKMVKGPTWVIRSKSDPRWDGYGYTDKQTTSLPPELVEEIKTLTRLYGDEPKDLSWGYMP